MQRWYADGNQDIATAFLGNTRRKNRAVLRAGMHRRGYLTATGASALAALAGCTGVLGAVPAPKVPETALEDGGWVQTDESQSTVYERSYGPITLTAKSHTLTYEDQDLRASIREKTLNRVDGQMALFSATRIHFSPNLADLPGDVATGTIVDRTAAAARSQFEAQMADAGLESVQQADSGTLSIETGQEAELTTYEAEFPFESVTFPVTEEQSVTVPGAAIAVAGDLAVWSHGDSVLVAGGAYPAANLTETITEHLSSAISVTVDVDLGLEPERYREEVRSLIGGVE